LNIPSNPKSVIMFAHGSDSSASSPRNKFVADTLNDNGFATLIVDLLTVQEQESDEILTGIADNDINISREATE